jgi:hypothetical protein
VKQIALQSPHSRFAHISKGNEKASITLAFFVDLACISLLPRCLMHAIFHTTVMEVVDVQEIAM